MRKFGSLAGAVLLLGCMDNPANTTAPKLSGAVVTGAQAERNDRDFNTIETKLSGDEEAPVVRVTAAHGSANVRLSKDGQSVDFVLVVNDISNITQAHIHMAAKGVAGPIVVWLYPSVTATQALDPGAGPHSGILASGTFTAANLVGPLKDRSLADFIAAVVAGNTYVNVHTNDGVDGTNTGPGDFPAGEIRGQLDKNGH
jgi:hypothetical protein